MFFKIAKKHQIFGLLLLENILPDTFKSTQSGHTGDFADKRSSLIIHPPTFFSDESILAEKNVLALMKLSTNVNRWAGVVVEWSACKPSTPTIRVRNPAEAYSFFL